MLVSPILVLVIYWMFIQAHTLPNLGMTLKEKIDKMASDVKHNNNEMEDFKKIQQMELATLGTMQKLLGKLMDEDNKQNEKHLNVDVYENIYKVDVARKLNAAVLNSAQQRSVLNSSIHGNHDDAILLITNNIHKLKNELEDKAKELRQEPYVWAISNYTNNKNKKRIQYSTEFYSYSNGYKLLGKAHLHGFNRAEGSHLSLFFQLVPGDYDDILTWPFLGDVQMEIMSQTQPYEGQPYVQPYVGTITDDIPTAAIRSHNMHVFGRPTYDNINTSWGTYEFIQLAKLEEEYVKNDRLYIKITVI